MSATTLKIIAVICMTLDHLSTYLGAPLPLRYVGRFAAVIFFFCAAESAVHTRDRKQYLRRLYKMNLVMAGLTLVIPFILGGLIPGKDFPQVQNNIFSQLVPGVWIIDILESTKNDPKKRKRRFRNFAIYQSALIPVGLLYDALDAAFPRLFLLNLPRAVIGGLFGSLFATEGMLWLTLLIVFFYLWRDSKKKLAIGYSVYCALYALIMLPQLPARFFWFMHWRVQKIDDNIVLFVLGILGFDGMQGIYPLSESLLQYNFQCFMILALPLLLLYNGKRGKGFKKFFYIYYPAHIYVLYLIQRLVLN